MNIDRSRFLVLTAALAAATGAAGCTIIDERGQDAGGTPSDTATASDTAVSTTDTAPGGDGGTDAATDGSTTDGTTDGTTDARSDADAAPTCDDTVGTLKSCSSITGTGCTFEVTWCGTFATHYKTAVANKAIDCIATNSLPTCEGTGFDFQTCVDSALAAACPDPTAATLCQKWKDDCATASTPVDPATFTIEGCQKLVNGLTSTARDAVTTCFVTEGGCGAFSTLDGCVRGL